MIIEVTKVAAPYSPDRCVIKIRMPLHRRSARVPGRKRTVPLAALS